MRLVRFGQEHYTGMMRVVKQTHDENLSKKVKAFREKISKLDLATDSIADPLHPGDVVWIVYGRAANPQKTLTHVRQCKISLMQPLTLLPPFTVPSGIKGIEQDSFTRQKKTP
ncbi:MAG: hypothetical protein VKJ06_01525 [Vampirovibrionales bacterium]|nr:hypothetical protein [Vampirovibrionales bacterium]